MSNTLPHQASMDYRVPSYRVLNDNHLNGEALTSAKEVTIELPAFGNAQSMSLNWTLQSVGASSVLVNAPNQIDRIDIMVRGHDSPIRRMTGDELHLALGLALSGSDDSDYRRKLPGFYGVKGSKGVSLASGSSREFGVVLLSNFITNLDLSGKHVNRFDMRVVFRDNIVISGAGVPTFTSLKVKFVERAFVVDTPRARVHAGQVEKYHKMGREGHYLDMSRPVDKSYTLAANTVTEVECTIDGHSAGLFIMIRPSGYRTTGSTALTDFKSIGDQGELSLTLSGDEANLLTSDAKALTVAEIQDLGFLKYCSESRIYFISFSQDFVSDYFRGTINGVRRFHDKIDLRITPAAARTDAVVTFNCTNAGNDAGSYRLGWRGEYTSPLAYNASVSDMKAAFESLQVCNDNDIKSTFSASATTDFTLTLSNVDYDPVEAYGVPFIGVDTLADGGTGEICTVSYSTVYVDGSDCSGSMVVTVYNAYWKHFSTSRNGIVSRTASL